MQARNPRRVDGHSRVAECPMLLYTVWGLDDHGLVWNGCSLGVEYIAAAPARTSRAKALPPVADAEYGP